MKAVDNTVAKNNAGGRVLPVDGGPSTQPAPSKERFHYRLGKYDIYFLGIGAMICGQYFSWNMGLTAGLYSYLLVYLIMGLAYLCFSLCMAEVTGALPFAGGSYGIARCTLGFFPAFIIGISEAMEYIASVSIVTIAISNFTIEMIPSWDGYQPLICAFIYTISTGLQVVGGRTFWVSSFLFGMVSLVILLVYCFGCLWYVDFSANVLADPTQLYIGGLEQFMAVLPYSAFSFLGIEILNLASNDVDTPKTQIPIAQVTCMCTVFVMGLFVFFTTVALPTVGGIAMVASAASPMDNGFMMMFKVGPDIVAGLMLPPLLGSASGVTWAQTKLIHAMAESKLLPSWLAHTSDRFKTPHYALVVGTLIGYGLCLVVYFYPPIVNYLSPVCLLFAFMSYSGQCLGYISLKRNYPLVNQSQFKNPFGIAGAVYSLFVWLLGIVGVCGFQGHQAIELGILAVIHINLGIYYWFWARKHQTMSEEESKILLVAHIFKFNAKRRSAYSIKRKSVQTTNTTKNLTNHSQTK